MNFKYHDLTEKIFCKLDIDSIKENITKILEDFTSYSDDIKIEKTYEGNAFGKYNTLDNNIYINIFCIANTLQQYIMNIESEIESEKISKRGKNKDDKLINKFEHDFIESFITAVLVHEINHYYVFNCKDKFNNERNTTSLLEEMADKFIETYMNKYGTEIDRISGEICIALHNQSDGDERYNYIINRLKNIFTIIETEENYEE